MILGDWTAHSLAYRDPSMIGEAHWQNERTTPHTANDIVVRVLLRDLHPGLVVTGSTRKDACPADRAMRVNGVFPEAGTTNLIDYSLIDSDGLHFY